MLCLLTGAGVEDLEISWEGVVILEVVATSVEVASVEDEVVTAMILTTVQEETMVEDQVMEGAEGATVVVAQGMATRVVDLVAAAMEVMEAMMEVTEAVEITTTLEIMVGSSPTMGP